MSEEKQQSNNHQTTDGEEEKYVDGVCVNCGSKLALPEEVAQKLAQEGKTTPS